MNNKELQHRVATAIPTGRRRGWANCGPAIASATLVVLGLLPIAHAAGGHHAVDDAAILDPGQCQIEFWAEHDVGDKRTLRHAGLACRVGAGELGLNLDRTRPSGEAASATFGPQLKWAVPLAERWSAGLLLTATWQGHSPRFQGGALLVPLTWQASDTLSVNLSAGRDFRRGERDSAFAGAALEWAATPAWSFVAERFREAGSGFWRVGARWSVVPSINVDLSRTHPSSSAAAPWWTLGVTWVFDR